VYTLIYAVPMPGDTSLIMHAVTHVIMFEVGHHHEQGCITGKIKWVTTMNKGVLQQDHVGHHHEQGCVTSKIMWVTTMKKGKITWVTTMNKGVSQVRSSGSPP